MDRPASRERIQHMIDAIDRIDRFMEDVDLVSFEKDEQLQSAVLFHS